MAKASFTLCGIQSTACHRILEIILIDGALGLTHPIWSVSIYPFTFDIANRLTYSCSLRDLASFGVVNWNVSKHGTKVCNTISVKYRIVIRRWWPITQVVIPQLPPQHCCCDNAMRYGYLVPTLFLGVDSGCIKKMCINLHRSIRRSRISDYHLR